MACQLLGSKTLVRSPQIAWPSMENPPSAAPAPNPETPAPDLKSLPVSQRINALVKALNGAKRTNQALAACADGEQMLDVLLDASSKLGLGLTREQLANTPPIRDWVWWKNKEAVITIGDSKPRYQQDGRRTEPPEGQRKRFLGLF